MNVVVMYGQHMMPGSEDNNMPEVVDKVTDEVVEEIDYNEPNSMVQAQDIADINPNWDVEIAPGGMYDAMNRNVTEYAGGGKTGYSKIGMYKKGGEVKKK